MTSSITMPQALPRYDIAQSYAWNYEHAPEPVDCEVPTVPGQWKFCGLPVDSPLGMPAGPLLSGKWCLYYASLGFDVLTYKTVRSGERACYDLPNLQPVTCGQLEGSEPNVKTADKMRGSWAVSFGMPSKSPDVWRADVAATREKLPSGKLLSVSVVGTIQPDWTIDDLAADYAQCARWAAESGADCVETNFSCPNVSTCDGQLYQQPADARVIAERVREAVGGIPYIVKIGHLQESESAEALLEAIGPSVSAIAMTNSIATQVQDSSGQMMFEGNRRGICGDASRTASIQQTRMVQTLIDQRELPIELIGVGGVSTAEHVQSYLDAGASAVHIATAAMVRPEVGLEIRRDLALSGTR